MPRVNVNALRSAFDCGALEHRNPPPAHYLPSVGTARQILNLLEGEPGAPLERLAEETGIARNTLAIYCRVLEKCGAIAIRRVGTKNQYFLRRRKP